MEGDTLIFAQVMTVIVCSVAGFVGVALGARVLWRLGSRPQRPAAIADRGELQRLETAIDSVAIEVERISESQRFLVTLLAKRLPAQAEDGEQELPAPGAAARPITPR